ncbi:MAG: MBL fold metallo-hydrolase [Phycisphaerales bacterium]|nr:MAG: MBL fold metallo-hydrolase [Phycisphaerales bacterium]
MANRELKIHITNDPVYMENGLTLHLRDGGPCWFVDPGLPPQAQKIVEYVRAHKLDPTGILVTHGHADHIAGIDEVRSALGPVPVYLAQVEWPTLTDPMANLSGLMGPGMSTNVTDPLDLVPGETIKLDETEWLILDTAGHSPGGRSFYCRELGIVIVGDALFAGSVGRVDFPNSSGDQLMRNLHEQLMTLPDETRVLCGHGPDTSIGREKTTNPFLLHGL